MKGLNKKFHITFMLTCPHKLIVDMRKLLFIFILFLPASILAMERFDIVTTQQLSDMLELRNEGKTDFLLINTLDKLIADHQSIPGSINIPWSQIHTSSALSAHHKDKPVITYCMGYR